ncbi:MAG: hypothetical protein LBH84_02265 [Prevotellaceae bacterium]|jgi:hypothetical protein|nr:hypothetical protein [Prevotellaceae bacterium]
MKKVRKIALHLLAAFAAVAVVGSVASCSREACAGGTAVQALSGEWWVKVYSADMATVMLPYKRVATYNTAANTATEMIVDDYGNIFNSSWGAGRGFRVKTPCSVSDKTFGSDAATASLTNAAYTYIVKNGKIISGGAKSPGGLTTDSIYLHLTDLSDGTTCVLAGYRHTGWIEDEY